MRRAVDELVAEQILVRRQGSGTYVAMHSAERFLFQYFHVERSDGLREIPQSTWWRSSGFASRTSRPRRSD